MLLENTNFWKKTQISLPCSFIDNLMKKIEISVTCKRINVTAFRSGSTVPFLQLICCRYRYTPRGRSLEESMIFYTYNWCRISDLSKEFSESYGESAWLSKILEIDSESLKAAFITRKKMNCQIDFLDVKLIILEF